MGTAAMAVFLWALKLVKNSSWVKRWMERWRIRQSLLKNDGTTDTLFAQANNEATSVGEKLSSSFAENQRDIQAVLVFWFGQFSPDESQKRLWMIADSSQDRRRQVDAEISTQFKKLMLELCGDGDSTAAPSSRWNEWTCASRYGMHGKVAAIIVLDQFSRHILRHHQSSTATRTQLPDQTSLDRWALQTAELLWKDHAQELHCGMLPISMQIFSLLPFRHASNLESVSLVQSRIEELSSLSTQFENMLGRFRKATNRRMAVLQDEARRTGGKTTASDEDNDDNNDRFTKSENYFSDEDILETFAFDADMGPAANHPCVQTIRAFLTDRGIRPTNNEPTPVIVSLSGGVDSMVIASALYYLKHFGGYQKALHLWAVHIDYANRPESAAEADFVRRYCTDTLKMSFVLKRIDEVTRGLTARDDYERIARELRYSTYKDTIAKATQSGDTSTDTTTVVGVMLGHHRGDLRENVLSNAHKGCGPLDLSGMTAVSKNDGVHIFRPLLPLEKTAVFDYAHKFGVPYFKDTTPHWSTRGKLRNKLIPLLEDIYGEGSMKNLSNLAVESDECRALLEKSMIRPFLDSIQRYPMGIVFETAPWKDQALFFWKVVLREALHSASFGMFSDKSVVAFLERVQAKKLREGWLQCRRDYAVCLQSDGRVFVLYPSRFPFNKKDMFDMQEGQSVQYNEEQRVGPWQVKAEIISEKGDCAETFRLAERALPSMDHFMKGVIEYVVEVPTWKEKGRYTPRPLVFCHFHKASRPAAWKNKGSDEYLYRKVQETLPLLGNDTLAQRALAAPLEHGCTEEVNGEEKTTPKRLARVVLRVDVL